MMTGNINLSEVTEFGKISDIWSAGFKDRQGLEDFVKNVVMNMNMCDADNKNGYGIMLPDLSNIHVLVSNSDFPFDKLTANQTRRIDINTFGEGKYVILGYIWLCEKTTTSVYNVNYHFIEYIDSRISGLNIAEYMIEQYESNSDSDEICLLPSEIALGSEGYWKKYFEKEFEDEIKSEENLNKFITNYGLTSIVLKWENLFKGEKNEPIL